MLHENLFTVELALGSTVSLGSMLFFKDVPELRKRKVYGCVAYTSNGTFYTPSLLLSPTGATVSGNLSSLYLSLASGNDLFVDQVPLQFFNTLQFFQAPVYFKPRVVSFERSFIRSVNTLNVNTSVVLTFFYQ